MRASATSACDLDMRVRLYRQHVRDKACLGTQRYSARGFLLEFLERDRFFVLSCHPASMRLDMSA